MAKQGDSMRHQVTQASVLVHMGALAQSVIGIRAEASASDLHDQAMLTNRAIAGVISVGLSAPLHELNATLLNGYMQAIQVLLDQSSSLSERAHDLLASAPEAS